MSLSKTTVLSVVASLVRWWRSQLSTWGHKVIALDPDCPASRVAEIIVAPQWRRCFVSWLIAVMFSLWIWKHLDAIKEGQLHKEQICLHFKISDFWKGLSPIRLKQRLLAVVTSSQDLADIDLSKSYVLKTATGGYERHGRRSSVQKQIWKKLYTLADSADCASWRIRQLWPWGISVIVSGNGKDVTVFPVQEKYPPQ